MSTALQTISNKLATRFGMGGNTAEVIDVLKSTAFKGGSQVSDAQMTALMVVSDQYGLNPWTREIYAFPDKGGIVPVVGLDGWSRIINEHPQFDGLEFEQTDESCTCIMFRKDRSHATRVTEWLSECKRDNSQPWKSHPKRMLRHKALIQCARLSFGFVGIYDQDDAEMIIESTVSEKEINPKPAERPQLPILSDADFSEKGAQWFALIESGKKTPEQIIATISTKCVFTPEQIETIRSWKPKQKEVAVEIIDGVVTDNWEE
jgi:phage recombination protein Bet